MDKHEEILPHLKQSNNMKVWIQKPISEPPEKDGRFYVTGGLCGKDTCDYSPEFGWLCSKDYFTHYLVPAEGHFLTNEELEEVKMKVAELAWDVLTNSWGISKTEYLKSIK